MSAVEGGHITSISDANRAIREVVEARNALRHCTATVTSACRGFDEGEEGDEIPDPKVTTSMDGASPMPGVFDRHGSQEFLAIIEEIKSLHIAKSQDYGSDEDPLANIRSGADLLGVEPWKACLVRIADKVTRLRTFCHKGSVVFDGLDDTLKDLAAYCIISLALYREQK